MWDVTEALEPYKSSDLEAKGPVGLLCVLVPVIVGIAVGFAAGYWMGLQDGSLHGMQQLREIIQDQ